MQKPSVIFINRVYPPRRGATGRVLRDLAQAFVRNGWQVSVLTTGEKAGRERDGGVRVVRVKAPEKPSFFFGYPLVWVKLLFAALRQPKAHLVVSMTDPPMLVGVGVMAAARMKAKHIHWCQDLYPDVFRALHVKVPGVAEKLLSKMSYFWLDRTDKIVAIGRCMAKQLAAKGLRPKSISIIPNWPDAELSAAGSVAGAENSQGAGHSAAIDYSRFQGVKPHESQLKEEQKFRVLYAGNIGLAHPLNSTLEAAKRLNETNPEIEFVFVGEGPRFDKISKYRADHSLGNIRLLPYQPNSRLREVMESGDLHLISMNDEAAGCLVPSKIYSALAVARPSVFIGPYNTEVAKVIEDYKAGHVVAANDANALVETIKHYRTDGNAWFSAHQGAKEAAQVFLPEQSIDAWLKRARFLIADDIKN